MKFLFLFAFFCNIHITYIRFCNKINSVVETGCYYQQIMFTLHQTQLRFVRQLSLISFYDRDCFFYTQLNSVIFLSIFSFFFVFSIFVQFNWVFGCFPADSFLFRLFRLFSIFSISLKFVTLVRTNFYRNQPWWAGSNDSSHFYFIDICILPAALLRCPTIVTFSLSWNHQKCPIGKINMQKFLELKFIWTAGSDCSYRGHRALFFNFFIFILFCLFFLFFSTIFSFLLFFSVFAEFSFDFCLNFSIFHSIFIQFFSFSS